MHSVIFLNNSVSLVIGIDFMRVLFNVDRSKLVEDGLGNIVIRLNQFLSA
jgi:hypothetical protein